MSVYLALRQAVEPAIVSFSRAADERERSAALAARCADLLALVRSLLGDPGVAAGRRPAATPAVDLWQEMVASSMTLAAALVRRGSLDEVRRLADFFSGVGEPAVAADLRGQLGEAVMERLGPRLSGVRNNMPPDEIRSTITTLREILRDVPADSPGRNATVNSFLPPLAASVLAVLQHHNIEISYDSRIEHIASGGVAKYHDIVDMSLDELAAEFEETCPELSTTLRPWRISGFTFSSSTWS